MVEKATRSAAKANLPCWPRWSAKAGRLESKSWPYHPGTGRGDYHKALEWMNFAPPYHNRGREMNEKMHGLLPEGNRLGSGDRRGDRVSGTQAEHGAEEAAGLQGAD